MANGPGLACGRSGAQQEEEEGARGAPISVAAPGGGEVGWPRPPGHPLPSVGFCDILPLTARYTQAKQATVNAVVSSG
jgi:hypothetical protein